MRSKDLVDEIDESKSYYWQALVRTPVDGSDVYPSLVAGRFVALDGEGLFLQVSARTEVKDGAAASEGTNMKFAVGEIALDVSEIFGETPTHLNRIEVEIASSASFNAGVAEFVDETRDTLGLCPTRLATFELGLSAAGLNPSGASNLDLKQRTERSNEKARG